MPQDPADHYSGIAAAYAERNAPGNLPDAFFEVRREFRSRLDDGARVLDAGCGTGRDVKHFIDKGYEAVGVDVAEGMVEYARTHHDGDYVRADMRDLPFADDSYDAVWCATSVFLLPHDEQPDAIDAFHRVLGDDGLLYAGFKTAPEREVHEREQFGSTVRQYRWPADEVERLLADAGFAVERRPDSVNPDGYGIANVFGRA